MRKKLFAFSVATLLLTGCTEKPNDLSEKPVDFDQETPHEPIVKKRNETFMADPATFHFAADWLSDSAILFVEKDEDRYQVKSFDFNTGKTEILFEESAIIIELLIHPSKKFILLHTSDNPASAKVKILTTDGVLQHEIEVASTELAIEWNDLDPSLVLLTAFHQDWTYDLFLFNGQEADFGLLEIEDPFPKWYGDKRIAIGDVENHILDGGKIRTYQPLTGAWDTLDLEGVIYFDTFEDSLLTMQMADEETAVYRIWDLAGRLRSEWTLPAISNYSEWVIPQMEWLSDNSLVLFAPTQAGQLDELTEPIRLVKVVDGAIEEIDENHEPGFIRCSPSSQACLTGISLETIVDMQGGKKNNWLLFPE